MKVIITKISLFSSIVIALLFLNLSTCIAAKAKQKDNTTSESKSSEQIDYYESGVELREEAYAFERVKEGKEKSLADAINAGIFRGYVFGITDALRAAKIICVPKSVKAEQLFSIVINYIKNNPEKHLFGVDIVGYALLPTFSCEQKKRGRFNFYKKNWE